ncbi:MAG: hypothetical protein ABL995_18930 [Bryobacteraceae bacterium]
MIAKVLFVGVICGLSGFAQVNRVLPAPAASIEELSGRMTPLERNYLVSNGENSVPAGRTLYRWSVAAAIGGNVADIATSWNKSEANPVLGGRAGQFGVSSVLLKSSFVGVSLLLQHTALRHRPDLYPRLAWLNFLTTGTLGAVAAHNASIP